jgi:hypothetical protein
LVGFYFLSVNQIGCVLIFMSFETVFSPHFNELSKVYLLVNFLTVFFGFFVLKKSQRKPQKLN